MKHPSRCKIAWLAVLCAACTGVIEGPGSGPNDNGDGSGTSEPPGSNPGNEIPSPDEEGNLPYQPPTPVSGRLQARTWKLTHEQYRRSIQAALGVDVSLTDESGSPRLEPEVNNGIFPNLSNSGFVSLALAADYHELAEEVTAELSESQILALVPCGSLDGSCRDEFVRSAVERFFRRPATAEDATAYGALFDLAHAEAGTVGDPAFGFRSVLRGLLTSPYFLYRTEIGDDPTQPDFSLTPYELAAFLSYSVLDEPPSASLLAAARSGALSTTEGLAATLTELLGQPQATAQLQRFVTQWLEVSDFMDPDFGVEDKDVPGFEEQKAAIHQEALGFLSQHGSMDGTLLGILTAPVAPPSGALAAFYRSEPTAAAAREERTGALALGALLALKAKPSLTSPTLRGLFVRERFLCQGFQVPSVVPDITETQVREQPTTTRELYELHAVEPTCKVCHQYIDPIGFTFESFDAAGRFRSAQGGVPVDTTGRLSNTDVNRDLQDHGDLAEALAASEWVRECTARQAFRFYFGIATSPEIGPDGTRPAENRGLPPIQEARLALGQGGRMRDLLAALLRTPSTFERTRLEPTQE